MATLTADQVAFLTLCIKRATLTASSFPMEEIRIEFNLATKNAAIKRYNRIMEALGVCKTKRSAGANGSAAKGTAADNGVKKRGAKAGGKSTATVKKGKVEEDSENESGEEGKYELELDADDREA